MSSPTAYDKMIQRLKDKRWMALVALFCVGIVALDQTTGAVESLSKRASEWFFGGSSGGPVTAESTEVSFEEFLEEATDESLTHLQIRPVLARYEGKRATWKGTVVSVSATQLPSGEQHTMVLVRPVEPGLDGHATANFIAKEVNPELARLRHGQMVLVSGVHSIGVVPSEPKLNDARLEQAYPR